MKIDTEHPDEATVVVSQRRHNRRWAVTYRRTEEDFATCDDAIKHSVELYQVQLLTIVILPPATLPPGELSTTLA